MGKILVVEDDREWSDLLRVYLEEERHLVDIVEKGYQALERLRSGLYELVILDWILPDISGVELCEQLRQKDGRIPVLILTGRSSAQDKATALDAGADDYLVKPFNPTELAARVRALIRRSNASVGKVLKVKNIELDTATGRVTSSGKEIELRPKEFLLLELFMRHPNKSFTAEGIASRLWPSDAIASVDTVRTHIKTLRKKVLDNKKNPLIRTTRGLGYRVSSL